MDGLLLFDLLTTSIMLFFVIRLSTAFYRYHTKYNLALLVIVAILFLISVSSLVSAGDFTIWKLLVKLGIGRRGMILIAAVLMALLLAVLYGPEIRRFIDRQSARKGRRTRP